MADTKLQQKLETMIKKGDAVLIGSRAFRVHTSDSDTDIAMLWSKLPTELKSVHVLDIRNYYSVLPLHNSGLLKLDKVDILLFDSEKDMNSLRQAKNDLLKIPKYLLQDKPTRVHLFENALNHYGWEDTRLLIH